MDNTLHYLTYDPEAMWTDMHIAYMQAGGDPLYPGDEKDMLLRGTMAIFLQTYAAFDHAARMQTLRYAIGSYLDLIGEKRGIARIEAVKATGVISMILQRGSNAFIIPTGTLFTDGARTFATLAAVTATAGTGTLTKEVAIECTEAGTAGNAMMQGMSLYQVELNAKILSVTVNQTTTGGVDAEEDEAYRERIREGGFYGATTGPKGAYESKAMEVSASIVDAGAYRAAAGVVGIALIFADGLTEQEKTAIKGSVLQALSDDTVRPLTDTVEVDQAAEVPYTLNISYRADGITAENILAQLYDAAAEYQIWQENTIGRAFDPYKLLSMLYNAGATRAEWTAGSVVNGNTVAYTPIAANERLKGTVTLKEMEA
jgi:phage-related baseplate assembly protein